MSAPGYEDPPPAYDETSGQIPSAPNNIDPSAPPSYDADTDDIPASYQAQQLSQSPQRTIYIVKMPNEPTPIITVISPDLIPQYQNEHIVYPKSNDGPSQIQIIQPNILVSNTNTTTLTQPNRLKVAKKQRAALFTETATKKPLYSDLPPSYAADNNLNANTWKPISATSAYNASDDTPKTMVAHSNNSSRFQVCGSSDVINFDKRIPTEIANKYNLMYGRINLLIILYLWIVFIMIQIERGRTVAIKEYCYTEFPGTSCSASSIYYIACNQDPVCFVVADVWDDRNCFNEWSDCQCCADPGLGGRIQAIYIAFYVFLGVNTFRLLILTFALGMGSINRAKNGLYVTDPDTNKVKLQQYMNYLCDHPASYFIGIFYSDASKAMTEGIVHNVAFPSTKFLYLNVMLLYVPFFTLIGIITAAQINLVQAANLEPVVIQTPAPTNIYGFAAPSPAPTYPTYAPTLNPTYPTQPTTPSPTYYWETTTTTAAPLTYELEYDLLITCIVALILLCIGFIAHIHRWRKKNMIERINLKLKAEGEGKQIIVGNASETQEDAFPICGFKKLYHHKRIPADTAHKFNLVFRWINAFIFVYLWVLFAVGLVEYGWMVGEYGACVAYIVFLCFSTVRLMGVTLAMGIVHVDNDYNYIVNSETGKVTLRFFMDYLCDHPAGIIVGFLYPDVGRALKEGLIYNITFPEAPFLFANIMIFYLPIMIISSVQASNVYINGDLALLYTVAAIVCGIGIVSNGYRFKMKNDVETAN